MSQDSDIIRSCPVADELVTEDGAVLLIGRAGRQRVVRLSGVGQLIRELAADGITFDHLVAELEDRLGGAPAGTEARTLVAGFVAALKADGVVVSNTQDKHANTRNISREL